MKNNNNYGFELESTHFESFHEETLETEITHNLGSRCLETSFPFLLSTLR